MGLFSCVVVGAVDWVELVCLPVLVGSLGPLYLLIHLKLVVMMLEVTAGDYVVVSQPCSRGFLNFLLLIKDHYGIIYLLFLLRRAFFRRVVVVLSHWKVA